MLNQIVIDNFATIEHLSFELGDRLNIITGETGAGKSVLVEAISTALGGRADISMIRTGTSKARIQIAGTVSGEEVVLTRELSASGKSLSRINGEMVSLAQLRSFCSRFVDVHGQYDNQQILDPENHLAITDRFGGAKIGQAFEAFHSRYDEWHGLREEYHKLLRLEQESLRQQDFYRFEYDHIEALSLKEGEDQDLKEQIEYMKNSEKIYSAVQTAYALLQESDDSILSSLQKCMDALQQVSALGGELNELSSSVSESYYTLEDLTGTLRSIRNGLDFSENDIDRLSSRLSDIEEAKRKYHMDIPGILAYQRELGEKLTMIENYDYEKARLEASVKDAEAGMLDSAAALSCLRRENADRLSALMRKELLDLEFANNEFEVHMEKLKEVSPSGIDAMEFRISTNPGEPLRPLQRIASGGEISRIMLAFKHILGDLDQVETMIFDEIDTGISGKTALVVGRKMREIASHHQVICITHLPQIAAYGTDNYLISKDLKDGRTYTSVRPLDREDKVHMLAGMISGDPESESAMKAASDLMGSLD